MRRLTLNELSSLSGLMRVNMDGPYLDNFDGEKFVSDWIESVVTSRHVNGHNSSWTETREEADKNVFVL